MDTKVGRIITIVGFQSILVVYVDNPAHTLKIKITRGNEAIYFAEILSHTDSKGITVKKIVSPKVVHVNFMEALIILVNVYLNSYKPAPIKPKLTIVR